jgi:hypothetical protein
MNINGYEFSEDEGIDCFIASALVRLKALGWTVEECTNHSSRILHIIQQTEAQLVRRVARAVAGPATQGDIDSEKWLCLVNANYAHEGFVFANVYHETVRMIEAAPNN